ncbi:MAG: hypothetical protein GY858_07415 [Candidatus Omnitrophica bacterium]|nr:hypothetical protein [Candidatus Omnitrophota bacterium]
MIFEKLAKKTMLFPTRTFTIKKAGWDCMRHYEIAANHTVPCFYKLSEKPKNCAPHGLVDMENVVAFDSADKLKEKINHIKKNRLYYKLRHSK